MASRASATSPSPPRGSPSRPSSDRFPTPPWWERSRASPGSSTSTKSSGCCAPTSARSSRPRSWRATSTPSSAATRRSRPNDRREEGRGQEAGPTQKAACQEGRRQEEAHVGHQRRRQLGPRQARAGRHDHRGWQLRLQRDGRLAQRGAGDRQREVRRLHALLLLLPRRLDRHRGRQGRGRRPRALQGLRHLCQGVPHRRHRHADRREGVNVATTDSEILAVTGNAAVAEAMGQIDPDVVCAYPITPATEIVQIYAQMVADGKVGTEFVTVESEHSAMSAVIGSAAGGVRTMTATSSQGFALMWEVLFVAASYRLPIVMTLSLIHISEPTRRTPISYAVFCLENKK